MSFLHTLLFPLTYAMGLVFDVIRHAVGSDGFAIVLLSILVRLVTTPIARFGRKYEAREREAQAAMAPALAAAKSMSSGRERFERTEAIYKAHGYHPIQSMASLVPLAVQIPFLLAALFLLIDHPALQGASFGPVADLDRPDGLLQLGLLGLSVNLLPIALTAVAISEPFLQPRHARSGHLRFTIVALVLLVLIYPLPAAVCLYWLTSNLCSFAEALRGRTVQMAEEKRYG